ncbi:inositol phospholipid synthesis and fat-storage-inducing TM-domain-containing protein [Gaertneriomyces semiglobifer]|nr:inositol phospholipid synthesis and fat-storage-inducing TM-domain-containing protein [Gaertneriomyces semiglobifer]
MKPYQKGLLLFYAGTIIIGSIINEIDPPLTVFANKRNPINAYFAKKGWAWTGTTLLLYMPLATYLAALSAVPLSTNAPPIRINTAQAVRNSLLRLLSATLYWMFMTQWFVGHSVFDRILLSSGSCTLESILHPKDCLTGGGIWTGFDISGHCFLLVHMSLILYEELRTQRFIQREPSPTSSSPLPAAPLFRVLESLLSMTIVFLLILWWVMLLATSVYFHSWQEKFSGLAVGAFYWILVYAELGPRWGRKYMPDAVKWLRTTSET